MEVDVKSLHAGKRRDIHPVEAVKEDAGSGRRAFNGAMAFLVFWEPPGCVIGLAEPVMPRAQAADGQQEAAGQSRTEIDPMGSSHSTNCGCKARHGAGCPETVQQPKGKLWRQRSYMCGLEVPCKATKQLL